MAIAGKGVLTMRTVPTAWLALLALAGVTVGVARPFEHRVAADPQGTVTINNVSGSVQVTGWDRAEVEVVADVDDRIERVDVSSHGRRTTINVRSPQRFGFGRSASASLSVRIPMDSELEVVTTSADIDSRGVLGAQSLKTVSGNVRAEIAKADAEINTISGDVSIRGAGEPARLRVETVSGDARIDDIAGELDVKTISGDVRVRSARIDLARARTTSGDYDFQGSLGPKARFEAETISGDLSIRADAEAGYEYYITTFSGDIRSCFDDQPERTNRYGPGSRLSGRVGEGSAHLRLKTMSGDIDLCR